MSMVSGGCVIQKDLTETADLLHGLLRKDFSHSLPQVMFLSDLMHVAQVLFLN